MVEAKQRNKIARFPVSAEQPARHRHLGALNAQVVAVERGNLCGRVETQSCDAGGVPAHVHLLDHLLGRHIPPLEQLALLGADPGQVEVVVV